MTSETIDDCKCRQYCRQCIKINMLFKYSRDILCGSVSVYFTNVLPRLMETYSISSRIVALSSSLAAVSLQLLRKMFLHFCVVVIWTFIGGKTFEICSLLPIS